jgi:hypothetical protein
MMTAGFVLADDHCLGAFLHCAVTVRAQSRPHSNGRLLAFFASIKILQKGEQITIGP